MTSNVSLKSTGSLKLGPSSAVIPAIIPGLKLLIYYMGLAGSKIPIVGRFLLQYSDFQNFIYFRMKLVSRSSNSLRETKLAARGGVGKGSAPRSKLGQPIVALRKP